MSIWLTFIASIAAITLFTAAALTALFLGHWPLALFLLAVDAAVYRFLTYYVEHAK